MTPMKNKMRLAVLLGGRSAEHEVSLQSARNIVRTLDPDRYETLLIGIDKQGVWRLAEAGRLLDNPEDPARIRLRLDGPQVALTPWPDPHPLRELDGDRRWALDAVFPVLHGPFGEDGTIQGLLDLAGLPCVGAGVLGSAAAMDKDVAKRLLLQAGVPVARGEVLHAHEPRRGWEELTGRLGQPLFVKPANLGSSVGVWKVAEPERLSEALEDAFCYDTKILVEEFVQGREIECSVLGNERPEASLPGEIVPSHEFYSYEAKYLDPAGAQAKIPADLPPELIEKVRQTAVAAFQALCCSGLARVDFFVTAEGRVLVNEVNTLPGFTDISMYPKLWEASGLPQPRLLDRLVELALERAGQRRSLKTDFPL